MFTDDGQVAGGGTPTAGNGGQSAGNAPVTFEAWIESQDETVRGLLDGHTKGLKSALDSERESRKSLEKQVRELAAKAEKGGEAEKQLTALADQLTEAGRKTDFYDAAHKQGVTNLKLAWMTAVADDLFDKKGNVDFASMKATYPELFGAKVTPRGNAGDGTEDPVGVKPDVNTMIRRMAGRTSAT